MTYFGVLAMGLLPPLLILASALLRQNVQPDKAFPWRSRSILAIHVLLAVGYTTPWDNYLVATRVWWYDPARVTGITLGWVPLEEYLFFVLQTLLTGMWTLWLIRRLPASRAEFHPRPAARVGLSGLLLAAWGASVVLWFSGWPKGTYLSLILAWAIPPLLVQVGFGGDILLSRARALIPAITMPTVYLWFVDSLAIRSGVWTINPEQITGLGLGSLPIEEMLFFLMTNLLVACGVTLMASRAGALRLAAFREAIRKRMRFATALSQTDSLQPPSKTSS